MLSIRGCSLYACLSLLVACGNPSGDPIPNPETRAPVTTPVEPGPEEIPVSTSPVPAPDTCQFRDLQGICFAGTPGALQVNG